MIVAILLSSIIAYQTSRLARAEGFTSIDLKVTPEGDIFKIGVNESKTFTAQALNGTAPFTFTWIITASNSFNILINEKSYQINANSPVSVQKETLTLQYPIATEELVKVDVLVVDANGLLGRLLQPFIVADPYTSSGVYLDSLASVANFVVQADGLGWFRAINGATGAVLTSDINSTTVITAALTSCTSGGSVYVSSGSYSAVVEVPDGIRLVIEKGVLDVTYSVASGATVMVNDWENGYSEYYLSGAQTAFVNWTAGTTNLVSPVSWDSSWNTTVQQVVDAYSGMAWKTGWTASVQSIVNLMFTSQAWNSGWNTSVAQIITSASILWSQITNANATVQQVVDAYSGMAWKGGWNTTVQAIVTAMGVGTTWQGSWNATVTEIV
ncbi:MAG: hypothetical protein PHH61_06500, partial [Candidatus Nanoarchaeia archaeon]|nr:hypothetical protein [Candidatus Nanoarchaeia archaeon]